jgi:hypothetical protein
VHEVLVPMATVVHQGMSLGREPEGKMALTPDCTLTQKRFFVDDCYSWPADGPMVGRFFRSSVGRREPLTLKAKASSRLTGLLQSGLTTSVGI